MSELVAGGARPLVYRSAADAAGPLPDTGPRVGADRGTPMTRTASWHEGGPSRPAVGVWECTPGGWEIADRDDTEVLFVTAGRARLTDADGESVEITAGDTVVLPRGWSGRWDVLETLRKVYVLA